MITAASITDEQIRELRDAMRDERVYERMPDGAGSMMNVADLANQIAWSGRTGSAHWPTPQAIRAARARCAEILNARAKEVK